MKIHEGAEKLKDEHVEAFAGLNGFALDIHNRVHVLLNGRVISQGTFAPDRLKKAQENAKRKPENKPYVADTDLSHLFNTTVVVKDFDRLLNLKVEAKKWSELQEILESCFDSMCTIHKNEFSLEIRTRNLGITKQYIWDGYDKYEKQVEYAKKKVEESSLIKPEHKTEYDKFFNLLDLSLDVSYAQKLYRRLDGSEEANEKFEKYRQIAEDFMREMGASDHDVAKMNAIIVTPEKERSDLFNKYLPKSSWYVENIRFVPDDIFEFLDGVKAVHENFEKAIKEQEKRIKTPAPKGDRDSQGHRKLAR